MSKKRRRKPSTARTTEEQSAAVEVQAPEESSRPRLPESPFPKLGATMAAGLRAVGSSPAILAVGFLSLLFTWGTFVAMGEDTGPRTMAHLMSVPPVHVFTDTSTALSSGEIGTNALVAVAGFTLLRAVTFGLLLSLIAQALTEGGVSLVDALRGLPRSAFVFGTIYLIEFALVVAASQLLVGFLGQLAILSVAVALYFLAFAPVVAAAEGVGPREALRRGFRAARLPGMRHLSMVFGYFLVLIYSGTIAPFPFLTPITPSVGVWAYGLGWTFIHLSVLGGLAHRWMAVRDQVPEGPPPRGS